LYRDVLTDATFHQLLLACDRDLADTARGAGCKRCNGVVHSAHYWRTHDLAPIVAAKRLGALYWSGSSRDWIKVRNPDSAGDAAAPGRDVVTPDSWTVPCLSRGMLLPPHGKADVR
jgi:hypothetical protein